MSANEIHYTLLHNQLQAPKSKKTVLFLNASQIKNISSFDETFL